MFVHSTRIKQAQTSTNLHILAYLSTSVQYLVPMRNDSSKEGYFNYQYSSYQVHNDYNVCSCLRTKRIVQLSKARSINPFAIFTICTYSLRFLQERSSLRFPTRNTAVRQYSIFSDSLLDTSNYDQTRCYHLRSQTYLLPAPHIKSTPEH